MEYDQIDIYCPYCKVEFSGDKYGGDCPTCKKEYYMFNRWVEEADDCWTEIEWE